MSGHRGREKREKERRGKARITNRIQGFWWAARISNTGRWDEKNFRKVYRIPA
jgi:hypothetical protein